MGASQVERLVDDLRAEAARLVVDEVPVAVAAQLLERCAGAERVLCALRVRLAHRVTGAGAHQANGDRDEAAFFSRVSGSSRSRAKAELVLAERLDALPEVARAFSDGRLSTDQAQVVAQAAAANPGATGTLLQAAATGSFTELRQAATRAERAVRSEGDEVARERRLFARRYCRTWVPRDGGLRLDALLATVEGARLLAALTKRTDQLLDTSDEPAARLGADALVGLCCGEAVATEVVVRVDAQALVRGEVEGDERCEIPGVGPVSVTAARSLLGEAFLTLLAEHGADVTTVTSTTRVVPRRVRMALVERDPTCVVPGCGASLHLEIDHWRVDFARGGLTALDNLCRLCSVHHQMKTDGRLHLHGGPGRWSVTMTPTTPPARRWGSRARAGP